MKANNDQVSKTATLSSVQFFNALNKYIPSLVLQNWIDKQKAEEEAIEIEKKMNRKSHNLSHSTGHIASPKTQLPYIQDMETVVLFADISGFTKISEACAVHGIRGNEELAFCINRYMEGMVKNLAKYGGDIIKFVGDAMIVMWPRAKQGVDDPEGTADDEKVIVIRKAIQCAWDIQKDLNNKKILANVTNLQVKIGISFGKCALLYVGGVFDRAEFFTVGSALTNALKSEEQATEGGQIIVSDTAFRYVKNQYYDGVEINDHGKKFYRVLDVIEGVGGRADAVLLKSQIKHDRMATIQKSLRSCVPAAIMPYLEIGFEQFGSETRPLTIMFASLGVDLSSASTQEGMNKIQKVVVSVQQQVYRMKGSLNKLVMDDKGSTLICVWGLCPMAHTDDAQRAIFTAMNMRRELMKIENTTVNVGIATGDVFSGVVGTSGSRKEFSTLGDTVNLAARIMFYPKKFGQIGKINCCLRTKNEAMNTMIFKYGGHCEFKGKSVAIPIYEPQDPVDELLQRDQKDHITSCFQNLKLHFNPMISVKEINHKRQSEPFVGKGQFVNEIYEKIKQYLFGQNFTGTRDLKNPICIALTAVLGQGKTHLARTICEKLLKDQDFMKQNVQNSVRSFNTSIPRHSHMRHFIFAASNNCDFSMKFLGAWRPILKNMMLQHARNTDRTREGMMRHIMRNDPDKVDIILEIFGIITNQKEDRDTDSYEKSKIINSKEYDFDPNTEQIRSVSQTKANNQYWFLARQEFSEEITYHLLRIVINFIREFSGKEEDEDTDQSASSPSGTSVTNKQSSFKKTRPQIKTNLNEKQSQPCVLIFDQASMMENESYLLILKVFMQCHNIVIFTLLDQDNKGQPIFPKQDTNKKLNQSRQIKYKKISQKFIDNNYIYDMPPLTGKDLRKLLVEMAYRYNVSFAEEVKSMTDVFEPEGVRLPGNSKELEAWNIKKAKSEEWIELLTKKFNLQKVFMDVENDVIDIVINKCNGNTIYCLHFFFHLLTNGYIEIDRHGTVIQSQQLHRCKKLQNFTSIPVPSFAIKKRLKELDAFLLEGKDKGNARKREIQIKGLMLLKTAAIIGEEFGTMALKQIIPLRNETVNSIYVILKELELAELIEILDETDLKNIQCRFNSAFLRESIYQVMLYRDQKQVLHQQLADFIQSQPSSIMSKEQIETEIEKLRNHILIGEDVKSEDALPFKQKYGIIVKQMQNILISNNQNIPLYQSMVFKQGKKASKKISKRLLILTSKELIWYHNNKEYEANKRPLGMIKVENIFKVFETIMQTASFDFEVAVTQYIRKGVLDTNIRNIKFGCESENDRNHWISRIEFLKAKLVYDQYVNKFFNIQFPLKKDEDQLIDDTEQKKDALIEQLHQFGKNFKQNARIDHSAVSTLNNLKFKIGEKMKPVLQPSKGSGHDQRQSILTTQSLVRGFGYEQFDEYNQDSVATTKSLQQKLSQLYNASIVGCLYHVSSNANKSQQIGISKKVGKLPDFFQPDWMNGDQPQNQRLEKQSSYNADGSLTDLDSINSSNSPTKYIKGLNKLQSQGSEKYIQQRKFSDKPPNFNQRKSVRVTNHDQAFQEIKEQSEGSSSNSVKNKMKLLGQKTSDQVKSESARIIKEQKLNLKQAIHNNQEKNSGNSSTHVTRQLQMLEKEKEDKKLNEFKNYNQQRDGRGFTFHNEAEEVKPSQETARSTKGQTTQQEPAQSARHHRVINSNEDIRNLDDSSPNGLNVNAAEKRGRFGTSSNSQIIEQKTPQNLQSTPNRVVNIHNIDGISSINDGNTDYNYQSQMRGQNYQQDISPQIQQEITTQINIGLRQFFERLDQKLTESKRNSNVSISKPNDQMSMQQLYENTHHQIDQNNPYQQEVGRSLSKSMMNEQRPQVNDFNNTAHLAKVAQHQQSAGKQPNSIANQVQKQIQTFNPNQLHLNFIPNNEKEYGSHSKNDPVEGYNTQESKHSATNRQYRKMVDSNPKSKESVVRDEDDEIDDPENADFKDLDDINNVKNIACAQYQKQ